jgi:hypothetical protein
MSNSSINLVGLDFQALKDSFKSYLKGQSRFQDYDFDGSNFSVLLDVLAYNTYLNSFYTNMVASEMFLDTAQLRDSVISHAKELNYLPRSFRSSQANLNITITPTTSVSSVTIDKGTNFTAKVAGNTFNFMTTSDLVLTEKTGSSFIANNIAIYEGTNVTDTYVINYSIPQRFLLTNPTADISSIEISVIEDSGANTYTYTYAPNLFGVLSTSKVFFLQATASEQYEVLFGDDNYGRRPRNGAIVQITYRICSGELPNGASIFVNNSNIDGHANVKIVTATSAYGGAVNESIESIRFYAPRYYQTQERAVTKSDYETLLKRQYPEIVDITAYGGEEVDPPQYGKVFVAVAEKDTEKVSTPKKRIYYDFIKPRSSLSIDPVIVDAEFTFVKPYTNVTYNVGLTTKTTQDIKTACINTIAAYNSSELNKFNASYKQSRISRLIGDTDQSIDSSQTIAITYKTIFPDTDVNVNIVLDYGFEILQTVVPTTLIDQLSIGGVTSSNFIFQGSICVLKDDGDGAMYVTAKQADGTYVNIAAAGEVDYSTGIVKLNNFMFDSYDVQTGISIYTMPKSFDFKSTKNAVLRIKTSDINVNVEPFVS